MIDSVVTFAFDKQSARSRDADGRMRVKDCILSTAEVNPYRGNEIPGWDKLGLDANRIYELYRDPDEMQKALPTFEGIPLMLKHIPQTADDPKKEYVAGSVHSIRFDGKHMRGDLLVTDGTAIDLIESDTLSDLSNGYRYRPDMTPRTVNGRRVDGTMRDIEGNHTALVDDGRASGAHVADRAMQAPTNNRGDQAMALPNENNAPPAQQGDNAPPAAAAPPAAEPAAGTAEIGAALKEIAAALQAQMQMLSKLAGTEQQEVANQAPPAEGNGEQTPNDAVDGDPNENGDPNRDATGGAEDEGFTLEKGPKEGAFDEDIEEGDSPEMADDNDIDEDGNVTIPNQAAQEGTPARGGDTLMPTGAMDAKSIRNYTTKAVQAAVAAERSRAAGVDEAKRAVRPYVGDVYGMDNAGQIYREALRANGVDTKAIPKGMAKVAWDSFVQGRGNAQNVGRTAAPAHAMDSDSVKARQSGLTAALGKIRNLG